MARHVEETFLCDMPVGSSGAKCGQPRSGDGPTKFSVNGRNFEIDLCEKHQDKFENAIGAFVLGATESKASREVKAKVRKAIQSRPGTFTSQDVRDWLREQGREVAPRGRLPQRLVEEYQQAVGVGK